MRKYSDLVARNLLLETYLYLNQTFKITWRNTAYNYFTTTGTCHIKVVAPGSVFRKNIYAKDIPLSEHSQFPTINKKFIETIGVKILNRNN